MKIAVLIARILLGLIFVFFGLNIFLHFLPTPPLPKDLSGEYSHALFASHYILFVGAVQVLGGALLLTGRYVALGLVLLGPVIINILLFHSLMAPAAILPGIVATILWFIVFAGHRSSFAGILSVNG